MAEVKQKSIKKNFIMNTILTMSGFIFPIITFPYTSRVLGAEGNGAIRFASSVVAGFAMFAQLGIPTYGIKVCAKARDDKENLSKTVHELMLINLIMSVVVYVLFFAGLLLVPRFKEDRILLVIISSTIFFNMIGIDYLYRGLEQYTYITIRSLAFKIIAILMMFLMVKDKNDYVIYGAISIFASSASNIMNFINARKLISFKHSGKLNLKQHMKPIMMFFAMSCASQVYLNLDGIMLGFMAEKADSGYYDAAIKMKNILVSAVTSLGGVLLPRAAYYIEHKQMDEFRRIAAKALHFVWIFATPLMLYFILFAREGMLFLSGNKYILAIPTMKMIVPTILFIGVSNILGIQILIPIGKEKIVLYSEIGGAIIDLILNSIFIPKYKSMGAAFGTTVAELVVVLIQVYFMRNMKDQIDLKKTFGGIGYWKILLALALAVPASLWVKLLRVENFTDVVEIQSFILLAISAILYFGVYLVVLLVTKDGLAKEIVDSVLSKLVKKRKSSN